MRTIKFTHEEVDLLIRAFSQLRINYIQEVINVRGTDNFSKAKDEAKFMYELETKFCDLLIDIKKGIKDI